jgi:hypothetical protein
MIDFPAKISADFTRGGECAAGLAAVRRPNPQNSSYWIYISRKAARICVHPDFPLPAQEKSQTANASKGSSKV